MGAVMPSPRLEKSKIEKPFRLSIVPPSYMEIYGDGYGLAKFMSARLAEPCKKERHSMLLENSFRIARRYSY